jgi:hypothetical protein
MSNIVNLAERRNGVDRDKIKGLYDYFIEKGVCPDEAIGEVMFWLNKLDEARLKLAHTILCGFARQSELFDPTMTDGDVS